MIRGKDRKIVSFTTGGAAGTGRGGGVAGFGETPLEARSAIFGAGDDEAPLDGGPTSGAFANAAGRDPSGGGAKKRSDGFSPTITA
jgi:hypothetical protein